MAATNPWAGRRCLVTGGFGFGGSHLVLALLALGADVTILDRWRDERSHLVASGRADDARFVTGDVRDLDLVSQLMARQEIDTVFHLAAQPLVPMSIRLPLETLDVNANGTYVMLEAARRAALPRFVFASSGAYYGTTSVAEPIPETFAPLPAANLYAASKAAADLAVQGYVKTFGLKAGICRFMNTYGPGDTNLSRLVPRALHNLRTGADYDFGDRDDGSTELDFLHVGDMVHAYLCVADYLDRTDAAALDPVFNIGTGVATPVRTVAAMASCAYDGTMRTPIFRGAHRAVVIRKLLDASKASAMLGWSPRISLRDGLEETVTQAGCRISRR